MTDVTESELDSLKNRANTMGIKFHPSIGLETLREKVNAAITGEPAPASLAAVEEPATAEGLSKHELLEERRLEAIRLRRVKVTCMNPAKRDYTGDIFTFGNRLVGTVKKYVHFNEPWHVPQCILDQMVAKQYQLFTTVTDSRGNKIRKGKLTNEFAIEYLPDLTADEIDALAQRQAMAAGTAA